MPGTRKERQKIIVSLKQIYNDTRFTKYKNVYKHSLNVANLSLCMGKALKLDSKQISNLVVSSLLHDIGKTKIPKNILCKSGKLTPLEWQEMKKHCRYSAELLYKAGWPYEIIMNVLLHHERWDGTGYYSFTAKTTPSIARIIAICDSFDAMVSGRSYQENKSLFEATIEVKKMAGIQFDPEYTEVFLRIIKDATIRQKSDLCRAN